MVRVLTSHQCILGSIPGPGIICGLSLLLVLFLVKRFFPRYSGFPLSSKTNISKFQFDLDYCRALYHEPHALVIMQALSVFEIKFTFYPLCPLNSKQPPVIYTLFQNGHHFSVLLFTCKLALVALYLNLKFKRMFSF